MIVTCPQCLTAFKVDERHLPPQVAKARCSRCQHVFAITRPEPPQRGQDRAGPDPFPVDPEVSGKVSIAAPSQVEAALSPPEAPDLSPPLAAKEAPVRSEPETLPPKTAGSRPRQGGLAAMIAMVGGCLLGLLLGGLTLWYLGGKQALPPRSLPAGQPGQTLTPPLPPASPEELRNLRVGLHDARYQGLVHPQGGQLLVIQGEVINQTGEPRGPVRLKATLTDSLNQPVQELLFYSGTSLSDEELLQTDPEQIKRWLATPGGRLQRVLKPGASQPFTAVFFGVPDNLAEARFGFHIAVMAGPRVPAE